MKKDLSLPIATLILVICLIMGNGLSAQKYFTKSGHTEFKASVDSFEPVEAKSENTTAVLNLETGDVAALIFVRSFHFKVALMEEHFNENYMDSDKFPKATFKGKLIGFEANKLKSGKQTFALEGELSIKGKSKNIASNAELEMVDGKIVVHSEFDVQPADFDIEIPQIVREKIAKTIHLILDYELQKK